MTVCRWSVGDLLPHAGPAVMLDEVVAIGDASLSAAVTIGPRSPFRQENGVPAHVGIEYMAQTCGAFSGARARRAGEMPRLGFILGTRRYHATRAWFADGERLVVTIDLVYLDEEVGVFDCVIRSGGEIVANAQLMVSEPKNVSGVVGRQGGTDGG
jgi:predicted hotdog family 3-hydroxylacyl-ACP dehydratase